MDQLRRIVTILLGVSLAAKQLSFHTVGIFMENVRTIISLMPIVDVQLGLFSRHDPPRRAEGGLMKPVACGSVLMCAHPHWLDWLVWQVWLRWRK